MIHTVFRRLRLRLGFFSLAVFALHTAASAQDATGTVTGRVIDDDAGRALQGAIVRVVGSDLRTETGRDGYFVLRNVPAGEQRVEAAYVGAAARTVSVSVAPDGVTPVNFNFGAEVIELEKLTVTADAAGQARAINQQRVAEAMVNITSEELFGEMTDNNIARALQRIPGISTNSDGGTEIPRYVNIRGFDGSLNSVQLNGVRLPTSGTGQGTVYGDTARAFALDDLPANAISNIEVIKAPTPDMDGDTVGGIVNLSTKSAFEQTGRRIDFTVGVDYVDLRDRYVPNATFGYSNLLMEGRLGVSVNLSYYEGDEGFDNIDYDWRPLLVASPENQGYGLPSVDEGVVFSHEDTEYNNYFIQRERYGFAAALEYKLSDTTTLHFKPLYNYEKRSEDDQRHHKIFDNDHGRAASAPPLDLAVGEYYTGSRGRAIVTGQRTATEPGAGLYSTYESISRDGAQSTAGRITLLPNGNGRGSAGYRQAVNDIDLETYAFDFGAVHQVGLGELKWNLVSTGSIKDEERYFARFDRNNLAWAWDRPDIFRPDARVVNGYDTLAVPSQTALDRFINPSSSNINSNPRYTEETVWQAKADYSTPFPAGTGIRGTFKTGVKLRFMDREHQRDQDFFSLANFAAFPFADYLIDPGHTVSDFPMPYFPDAGRILTEALGGSSTFVQDTSVARRRANFASDYEASEDSTEAYVMGAFEVSEALRVTTGFRAEHTKFEARTPVFDNNNPPSGTRASTLESRENSYTQVLPGLHVRYEARNNLVFRGAYTQTYGRPAFRETVAVTTFDENANSIVTGNPDLDPYESENWDFSVEYYGSNASYFQAAVFHKTVDGFVLGRSTSLTGADEFNGIPLNPSETYSIVDFENAHTSVNRGVELVYNQRMTLLPEPFNGLYLLSSVTYTDSDGRYADRPGEKLPTYGASEWLYYAALGYQRDRFMVQVAYRYRSEYLEGLANVDQQFGTNTGVEDDWWGPERYWSLDSSYKLTENLKVFCNITNLAAYRNSSYQDRPEFRYPEDSYWHKPRIAFGLKGSF